MPHCPECGGSIDDFSDLSEIEKPEPGATLGNSSRIMYSCGECGVVLGFSDFAVPGI